MDIETLKIGGYVIIGGIVLLAVIRFALLHSKPKKCKVCGADAKDRYQYPVNSVYEYFCRNHVVETWSKDIIASQFDMVIIEPDFKNNPHGYLYATPQKLIEWNYLKEDKEKIESLLQSIKGNACKECGVEATVAYLNKEDYPIPEFSKIVATPTYLCKSCAVKKVDPIMRSAVKEFGEGVYAPTDGPGVYHVQEF